MYAIISICRGLRVQVPEGMTKQKFEELLLENDLPEHVEGSADHVHYEGILCNFEE